MATEQWIESLKKMSDFYPDFAWMQHIALLIIFIWWLAHRRRVESKRFLSGYFAFCFLAVCGAAGQFKLPLVEGLSFALVVVWTVDAFRGRTSWTPSGVGWRWWVIVPFIFGFWFPQYVSKYQNHPYLAALLFSSYSIWISPTLLVIISMVCLTYPQEDIVSRIAGWMTSLVGLFFGCLGVFKLKIYWNLPLIIVSLYSILVFCLRPKRSNETRTYGVRRDGHKSVG